MASSQVSLTDAVNHSLGAAADCVRSPFPHALACDLFDSETASSLLVWLRDQADWKLESAQFYVQHGCSDITARIRNGAATLACSAETLSLLQHHVERLFSVRLDTNRTTVSAHRLLPGHAIGIHNDCPRHGTETHRLVVHLNDDFQSSFGGHLFLCDIDSVDTSLVVVPPVHNSAAIMEFSARSWHGVDEVKGGTRYSLLYSFWTIDEIPCGACEPFVESTLDEQEKVAMVKFLREIRADQISHTGRLLLDHLVGTYEILQRWACDPDVCRAGLFHSVLGTESFPGLPLSEDQAQRIRSLIGERSYLLVRTFNATSRQSLSEVIRSRRLFDSGELVALQEKDVNALALMTWANKLEQAAYTRISSADLVVFRQLFECSSGCLPPHAREEITRILL